MKKRVLSVLLCLCMVMALLPTAALAANVTLVRLTITEPEVGASADFHPTLPSTASTEVDSVSWSNMDPSNPVFQQGQDYTVTIKVKLKSGSSNTFGAFNSIKATVNGKEAKVTSGTNVGITVKYTWTSVGGAAPATPESALKDKLGTLAAAFPATNGTTKNDVLTYVEGKLPGAAVWATNGNYSFKQRLATETAEGFVNMGIGVTLDGVTVEPYVFRATIPALNTSPDATNLAADKALMEATFKAFTPTAKTTGDELLAAVSAAATHGTKAAWGSNYAYKAPTPTAQGSVGGDIVLTLGSQKDTLTGKVKILPIDGSADDALIDSDMAAASKAVKAVALTNGTTQETLVSAAKGAIQNGTTLTCTGFQKEEATYDNTGRIIITFDLALNGKTRNLRVSMEIPKVKSALPTGISVTADEWEVLRLTNIERFKEGRLPLTMVGPLQDAADIRAQEITTFFNLDHLRPDGSSCFTAIDRDFSSGRSLGENLAMCQETPAEALNAWMNSTGHRTNLLTASHTYFGGGVATASGNKYWVQIFAGGGSVSSVASSTGSLTFASVEEMESAYLICTNSDGYTSYLPLDTEYMTQSGNSYTLTLRGKTVTLTVGSAPAKIAFTDVPAGFYYTDAVAWAVENKITDGTSATTFSPDALCTRAQILTFLWRAVGSPAPGISNPFSDVKSTDYYYSAALWAYEKGMVSGTAFEGSTPCTRSSTVTYLWQYAGSPASSKTVSFTDVPAGAAYAQAVAWAVEKGVTDGTSATTFSPDATCSRGQIVTFLYRAVK